VLRQRAARLSGQPIQTNDFAAENRKLTATFANCYNKQGLFSSNSP